MRGKTVLITGATDGIGKRTALELAKLGAEVILHGRNRQRGNEALEMVYKETGNSLLSYVHADLSSLSRITTLVKEVSRRVKKLDVLVNNAGIFSREHNFTNDGIESTFAVNHLAHFSLSLQLLPLISKAEQGRVVTVSSVAHASSPKIDFSDIRDINAYMDYSAYALSKLANVIFSNSLSDKLQGTAITSNSLHPGVITTKLLQAGFGISGDPVEEGCKTSVFLASDGAVGNVSGRYFVNSGESQASPSAYDPVVKNNLWVLSERLSGLKFDDFM